jgi:hypothetical protein
LSNWYYDTSKASYLNTDQRLSLAIWSEKYLLEHPDITWEEFESSFLMNSCDILKENSENSTFQGKMDSLKTRVLPSTPNHDDFETMITVKKVSSLSYYVSAKPKPDIQGMTMAEGTVSERDIALIHNHPDGHIPIFSHADLVSFYADYKFVITPRKNAYTYYVVNANGTTYALRMNDVTALDTLFAGMNLKDDAVKKLADDLLKKIFKDVGKMNETLTYTPNMAEKMFLKSLNAPELGGYSLSLYQQENGQWKKLTLNPDGSIQKTPCP